MNSNSRHWDDIFSKTEDEKMGWYEKDTSQTFNLLQKIPDWENSTVFIPGAGTSILIEELLSKGIRLILNDISSEALHRVKKRLRGQYEKIDWLCHDIAQAIKDPIPQVDIWIDRAVLHFLTKEDDIKGYFDNLKAVLKSGGHAIFAEFSMTGAPKCAGLTIHRYSVYELVQNLGLSFKLVSDFEYTYINPFGDPRPYIYALLKRDQ
ncbi:MAG: class I SAM-dependent methyltransferase [Desulfamplus sp.]|nr:class I SAM-dependent methyltransferase [Desulfamplus sp.]